MKARVIITPRPEVLDPQGKAVHHALARLGFDGVAEVRVGKSFDIELETRSAKKAGELLEAMCKQLLANEIMEDYEIDLGKEKSLGKEEK